MSAAEPRLSRISRKTRTDPRHSDCVDHSKELIECYERFPHLTIRRECFDELFMTSLSIKEL